MAALLEAQDDGADGGRLSAERRGRRWLVASVTARDYTPRRPRPELLSISRGFSPAVRRGAYAGLAYISSQSNS